MKTLFATIVLIFSAQGICENSSKGEKWKTHRDKHVTRLNEKKAMIQKNIDCMSAASTKEAFKACRDTAKKNREAFKSKYPRKNKK